ncbi:nuclear transport factor 2 family protein [Foetidibacter luteolus]|uniref:nuclear transport factor 2 family protein n=1 Tax=Foetidibacter luteolus TaxID=2608880 RepID=UPI00129B5393|nr:nuclear transport factor 2 family protein [Foetidibacter luteolus]
MKAAYIVAALLCMAGKSYTQADSLQQQINRDVWKPFIAAFNQLDTDGFMAVHSKNMTRVIQDDSLVWDYQQYYNSNRQGNDYSKENLKERTIELRFIQRMAANGKASKVGYYKTSSVAKDGTTRAGYGKFHVLLQKENGLWKILMDADAHNNTTEAIFNSAKPM